MNIRVVLRDLSRLVLTEGRMTVSMGIIDVDWVCGKAGCWWKGG